MAQASKQLELAPDIKDRLDRLAGERKRPAESLVQEAVQQYLDREEEGEQLNRGTVAAWEGYQRTGLHLTGEEVNAWLDKLAAGEDAGLPPLHT